MNDDYLDQVRKAVDSDIQLAIEFFAPADEIDFGLNRASLKWVEDRIEQLRTVRGWNPEPVVAELISLVGSFLGACIAADTEGEWQIHATGSLGVRLPNGVFIDPFHKAEKAILQGVDGGESIFRFHQVTVDHIATREI
ncbi:hypothetical protein [Nocardia sp.]|uniref:hypothetical protein n=1 Tax=Nocardia sp. TaxID=1821 RepID=UPI002629CCA2|nr:hypothetical protein [Nocardia sp.]